METADEKLTHINIELYSSMLEIIANKIHEGVVVTDYFRHNHLGKSCIHFNNWL